MDGDAEVFRNGQPGVTRMGLVKKLEGDPEHPLSQGKLCVRGQAAVQVTYHPDRIAAPMQRSGERGSGQFAEISWDEALEASSSIALDAVVVAAPGASRSRSLAPAARPAGTSSSPSSCAGSARRPPVAFELFDDAVLRRANEMSFGRYQLPTFDLARTRYVIGFGADFLGTWNSPLAQSVAYGRMRQGPAGVRARSSCRSSRACRRPARAPTSGWPIASRHRRRPRAGPGPRDHRERAASGRCGRTRRRAHRRLVGGLPASRRRRSSSETGVQAARVERLAREFAAHGPAVAVIGGAPLAHTNGLVQALAVNALNALVGSVDVPGGVSFMPQAGAPAAPARDAARLLLGAPPRRRCCCSTMPIRCSRSPAAWKAARGAARRCRSSPASARSSTKPARCRSDPAGSLVPRIVGRVGARVGRRGAVATVAGRRCGRSTTRARRPTCCSTSGGG